MADYAVTWEFDSIDADSPEDAARMARAAQIREGTIATVFDVTDEQGNTTRIDLTEIDEERASTEAAAPAPKTARAPTAEELLDLLNDLVDWKNFIGGSSNACWDRADTMRDRLRENMGE